MAETTFEARDLFDIRQLEKLLSTFTRMTGMSAYLTAPDGRLITQMASPCVFCAKFTRSTREGRKRCRNCITEGAQKSMEQGNAVAYLCHARLIEISAPIMAGDQLIALICGGQVMSTAPDEEFLRNLAEELEIDPEIYLKAAALVPVIEQQKIAAAADFLYLMANTLSSMAFSKYEVQNAMFEVRKASQMKSDFLANMSHEIRTPMNAVIGMAEMALREAESKTVREYIGQIKSSGKTLLTIINDILDFSKIDSGKMEIHRDSYAPFSIINDVSNIIMSRISDSGKDLDLILDIDPRIPFELIGDCDRVKQIFINVTNNAVKFTPSGYIYLQINGKSVNGSYCMTIAVKDTGIGIKPENLDKLFQSFTQIDSKRNRNIEGTGLGLAITKNLLELMGGTINVESVYGEGSTFTMTLPQRVNSSRSSAMVRDMAHTAAAGLISDSERRAQLKKDVFRLGIPYVEVKNPDDLNSIVGKGINYLFIDEEYYNEKTEEFLANNAQLTAVVIVPYSSQSEYRLPNVRVVKKPISTLNLAAIFNHENPAESYEENEEEIEFTAPSADILIVDDNDINLTVAAGLLKPLQMQIDTAQSGKEAIDMVAQKRYDIIFMDHMMPELDGVETTRIIRRFHPEYADMPIIALTANAVEGTREMFLNEGMNDFVAKPIEVKIIMSKVRRWLPPHKICRVVNGQTRGQAEQSPGLKIEGLDTDYALSLLGNEDLFWNVLKDYYKAIPVKTDKINQALEQEDWKAYTIEAHSLKSSSRQIGATKLSELAASLEKAGNEGDHDLIRLETPRMLEMYGHYRQTLKQFFPEKESAFGTEELPSPEVLRDLFHDMRQALANLDMDQMEAVAEAIGRYRYESETLELYKELRQAVEGLDVDLCEEILQKMEKCLNL